MEATRRGHVVYVSNHKSHLDYLVEGLVLDDHGIRPPDDRAGINLFGGPLGLLHRHVTGAIPIRRNRRTRLSLTLRRTSASCCRQRDVLFYPEGGRSYIGELKSPKTGLLHAACSRRAARGSPAGGRRLRPGARGSHHPAADGASVARSRSRWSRRDGALRGRLPVPRVRHLRRADSARRARPRVAPRRGLARPRHPARIGRLYKVLPTALLAFALQLVSDARGLETRVDLLIGRCAPRGEPGRRTGARPSRKATDRARRTQHPRRRPRGPLWVRDRAVLRYYSRTIQHSFAAPTGPTRTTDAGCRLEIVLPRARGQRLAQTPGVAVRHAPPGSFAHRFIAGETIDEALDAARAIQASGMLITLDQLGESVTTPRRPPRPRAPT